MQMIRKAAAAASVPARGARLLFHSSHAQWSPPTVASRNSFRALSSASSRSPRIDDPTVDGGGGKGARAMQQGIKGSVYKLNLLAQQIAGKNVNDALAQMQFSEKRRSRVVAEIIKTACDRAEEFHDLKPDELYVAEAVCGRGSYSKRPFYRGRGKVDMKRKTTSQLTVVVREDFRDPSTSRKGKNPRRMKNRRRPGEQ